MTASTDKGVPFDGIHELTEDLSQSPYYNRDMAPTTRADG